MYTQLIDLIRLFRKTRRSGHGSYLNHNSRFLPVVALFGSLLVTGNAQAMLVNIDFQPSDSEVYNGQGVLGTAADHVWNSVDEFGATNLLLSNGSSGSGISVSTSMDTSYSNLSQTATYVRTNTLLADRIYGSNNNGLGTETIVLSGLTPNSAYSVALYNGFYAQSYSVNGQSATTDPVAASSANNDFPNWTAGVEYALLPNVLSDSYGHLVIQTTPIDGVTGFTPRNSAIAALQIQDTSQGVPSVVPVPPALYLFATGIIGLVGIARRGRKQTGHPS